MSHHYNPYATDQRSSAQVRYGHSSAQAQSAPQRTSHPNPGSSYRSAPSVLSPNIPSLLDLPLPPFMAAQRRPAKEENPKRSADLYSSRAREESLHLPHSYATTQPFQGHRKAVAESSDRSLDWLPTFKSTNEDDGSKYYTSASSSIFPGGGESRTSTASSIFPGGGESRTSAASSIFSGGGESRFTPIDERKPHEQSIFGLGKYEFPVRDTASAQPEFSQPKYTSELASNILQQFGLEKEDLEQLLSYTEDQITPQNLPLILCRIREQKTMNPVSAVKAAPYAEPKPTTSVSDTDFRGHMREMPHQDYRPRGILKTSKVIDYGHVSRFSAVSVEEVGMASGAHSVGSSTLLMDSSGRETEEMSISSLISSGDQESSFPRQLLKQVLKVPEQKQQQQQPPVRQQVKKQQPAAQRIPMPQVDTASGVPAPAQIFDYVATPPRMYPHSCSLCNKECLSMKEWINHQNTELHLGNCKLLRTRFPEWDGEHLTSISASVVDARSSTTRPSQSLKKRRNSSSRSRSRSYTPQRHRGSGSRRDHERSRYSSSSRSNSPRQSSRRTCRSSSRSRSQSPLYRSNASRYRSRSRSNERRSSPRQRDDGPSSAKRRWSGERRSSEKSSARQMPSGRAEALSQKLLGSSAIQSLSKQMDLEAVVKTLAPAILAELTKMKTSPSSSSSSSASKKNPKTKTKMVSADDAASTVRLLGVSSYFSYSDLEETALLFGKPTSVVIFRKLQEAQVVFEKPEDAEKMRNAKSHKLMGMRVKSPGRASSGSQTPAQERKKAPPIKTGKSRMSSSLSKARNVLAKPVKVLKSGKQKQAAGSTKPSSLSKAQNVTAKLAKVSDSGKQKQAADSTTESSAAKPSNTAAAKKLARRKLMKPTVLNKQSEPAKGTTGGPKAPAADKKGSTSPEKKPEQKDKEAAVEVEELPHKSEEPAGQPMKPTVLNKPSQPAKDTSAPKAPAADKECSTSTEKKAEQKDMKVEEPPDNTEKPMGLPIMPTLVEVFMKQDPLEEEKLSKEDADRKQKTGVLPLTGEMLGKNLLMKRIACVDMKSVFSPKFASKNKRVLQITNLPKYEDVRYTERDVAKLLTPFGFPHEDEHLHNIYVILQKRMALAVMPTAKMAIKVIRASAKNCFKLSGCELIVKILEDNFNTPMEFYRSLMMWMDEKIQFYHAKRIIFIKDISPREARNLREVLQKIGNVKNYTPLLNKVFIEFDTIHDADRLGVWYSLLNEPPQHSVYRLATPRSTAISPLPKMAEKALPDLSLRLEGTDVPMNSGIPLECGPPFYVTMTTFPFIFPTSCPWFNIPPCHDPATMSSTVMMTGLPENGYCQWDVARIVWGLFYQRNVVSMFYRVMVLPLQRRAFIYFNNPESSWEFSRHHSIMPFFIKDQPIKIYFVNDNMNPGFTEVDMYRQLMKMSNARVSLKPGLHQRLLVVLVSEVSLELIQAVMKEVASVGRLAGFLPLGNRICIEMLEPSDRMKVMEAKLGSLTASRIWRKVIRVDTVQSLHQLHSLEPPIDREEDPHSVVRDQTAQDSNSSPSSSTKPAAVNTAPDSGSAPETSKDVEMVEQGSSGAVSSVSKNSSNTECKSQLGKEEFSGTKSKDRSLNTDSSSEQKKSPNNSFAALSAVGLMVSAENTAAEPADKKSSTSSEKKAEQKHKEAVMEVEEPPDKAEKPAEPWIKSTVVEALMTQDPHEEEEKLSREAAADGKKKTELTMGEMMEEKLLMKRIPCVDIKRVLSRRFIDRNNRKLQITNLPKYEDGIYTEQDVANLLTPFGFQHEDERLHNIYVIPQKRMALAVMPTAEMAINVIRASEKDCFTLFGCKLIVKILACQISTPMGFYQNLMKWMNEKITLDQAEKIVFIKNISPSEARNLREVLKKIKRCNVMNYTPLLNKVFIEFYSRRDADCLGVWYSLLRHPPQHNIYRLGVPWSTTTTLCPVKSTRALPDHRLQAIDASVPMLSSIDLGCNPPFNVTMTTFPFIFPTEFPWFDIPPYQDPSAVDKPSNCSTIMMTGLPVEHYCQLDVVRMVWGHLHQRNVHSLFYRVMVLPLQRRAFIYFNDPESCRQFSRRHIAKQFRIGYKSVKIYFLNDNINPEFTEETMYRQLMKLSNAHVPPLSGLDQRLLVVQVSEVSLRLIQAVLKEVASVGRLAGFLPLGNRICIEMLEPSDRMKVMEAKLGSLTPPHIWEKVIQVDTVQSLHQRQLQSMDVAHDREEDLQSEEHPEGPTSSGPTPSEERPEGAKASVEHPEGLSAGLKTSKEHYDGQTPSKKCLEVPTPSEELSGLAPSKERSEGLTSSEKHLDGPTQSELHPECMIPSDKRPESPASSEEQSKCLTQSMELPQRLPPSDELPQVPTPIQQLSQGLTSSEDLPHGPTSSEEKAGGSTRSEECPEGPTTSKQHKTENEERPPMGEDKIKAILAVIQQYKQAKIGMVPMGFTADVRLSNRDDLSFEKDTDEFVTIDEVSEDTKDTTKNTQSSNSSKQQSRQRGHARSHSKTSNKCNRASERSRSPSASRRRKRDSRTTSARDKSWSPERRFHLHRNTSRSPECRFHSDMNKSRRSDRRFLHSKDKSRSPDRWDHWGRGNSRSPKHRSYHGRNKSLSTERRSPNKERKEKSSSTKRNSQLGEEECSGTKSKERSLNTEIMSEQEKSPNSSLAALSAVGLMVSAENTAAEPKNETPVEVPKEEETSVTQSPKSEEKQDEMESYQNLNLLEGKLEKEEIQLPGPEEDQSLIGLSLRGLDSIDDEGTAEQKESVEPQADTSFQVLDSVAVDQSATDHVTEVAVAKNVSNDTKVSNIPKRPRRGRVRKRGRKPKVLEANEYTTDQIHFEVIDSVKNPTKAEDPEPKTQACKDVTPEAELEPIKEEEVYQVLDLAAEQSAPNAKKKQGRRGRPTRRSARGRTSEGQSEGKQDETQTKSEATKPDSITNKERADKVPCMVLDPAGSEAFQETQKVGRRRSTRGSKEEKITSQTASSKEEPKYQVIDSVEDFGTPEEEVIVTRSTRGRRGQPPKREIPTRGQTTAKECEEGKETSPKVEETAVTVEGVAYKVINSIEDEGAPDAPPASRQKRKRGRPRNVKAPSKPVASKKAKVEIEEEPTDQIMDFVEEEAAAEDQISDDPGTAEKSSIPEDDYGKQKITESVCEEDKEEPTYQIVDSGGSYQGQKETEDDPVPVTKIPVVDKDRKELVGPEAKRSRSVS